MVPHWMDNDEDGFGRPGTMDMSCAVPSGRVDNDDDCDDLDRLVYPGAEERCNAVDDNCNEVVDEDRSDESLCGCDRRENEGSLYQFCDDERGWVTANRYCQSRGYELVEINDEDENDFVTRESGGETWIGLNDREIPNEHRWSSGGTSMYRNWAGMEPDRDVEPCVKLSDMSEWRDVECDETNGFICETAY